MAQGFVRNLNLVESSTKTSDIQILDNLGGVGISNDIILFSGNSKIKSALQNDPDALSTQTYSYEGLTPGKTYRIVDVGDNRDWQLVGALTSERSIVFEAVAPTSAISGSGGVAREVIGKKDFSFINDSVDGWTVIITPAIGKVAFTTGTILSLDRGNTYPIKVINSDGFTRFQVCFVDDPNNTPLSVSGGNLVVGLNNYNIDDMSFTRSDAINIDNMKNIYVEHPATQDESELESLSISERILNPFERSVTVEANLDKVQGKKNSVILSYLDDHIIGEGGVRFEGGIRIKNLRNSSAQGALRVLIGEDTTYGNFSVGYDYEITNIGSFASWDDVGGDDIDTPETNSGSFSVGKVYKLSSIGNANIGDDTSTAPGVFTFSNLDVNFDVGNTPSNQNTIKLSSQSHGLVVGDKVVYRQGTGASITGLTPLVPGLEDGVQYVVYVNLEYIKLSGSFGGQPLSIQDTGIGNDYTLTVDPQRRWNEIAGTDPNNPNTYAVNSYFKAATNGAELTGAKGRIARFTARTRGAVVYAQSTAKAINPPGLYILNPQNGVATRAFSDPSNPWLEETSYTLSKSDALGGGNFATVDALRTKSLIAQAQDFNFERADLTLYGDFVANEHYKIIDLGTRDWNAVSGGAKSVSSLVVGKEYTIVNLGSDGSAQSLWNDIAGTSNVVYSQGDVITILRDPANSSYIANGAGATANQNFVVGDGFFASEDGQTYISTGNGGSAKGSPKILFLDPTTNTGTDVEGQKKLKGQGQSEENPGDGLSTFGANGQFTISDFTHKIPIVIDGEEYALLAYKATDQFYYVLAY